MQPAPVDLGRRDDPYGERLRARHDAVEELLALVRRELLRVVQPRERTAAVIAQELVVEKYAGDHERPGQRPTACFVHARDEPPPEAAVELEEAPTPLRWFPARALRRAARPRAPRPLPARNLQREPARRELLRHPPRIAARHHGARGRAPSCPPSRASSRASRGSRRRSPSPRSARSSASGAGTSARHRRRRTAFAR